MHYCHQKNIVHRDLKVRPPPSPPRAPSSAHLRSLQALPVLSTTAPPFLYRLLPQHQGPWLLSQAFCGKSKASRWGNKSGVGPGGTNKEEETKCPRRRRYVCPGQGHWRESPPLTEPWLRLQNVLESLRIEISKPYSHPTSRSHLPGIFGLEKDLKREPSRLVPSGEGTQRLSRGSPS